MDRENGKRDFCTGWWLIFLTMVCVLVLSNAMGVIVNEGNYYMASFIAELSIFIPIFIGYKMLKKRREEKNIGLKKFPIGILPYLLILPIVAQPFINIFTLPAVNIADFLFGIEEVVDVVPVNPGEWIFAVLTLCVVAPVAEELFCRGIMMQYMKEFGLITSLVSTSLVFAMLHFSPASLIILFFLGLLLGVVKLITDSLWACIIMHSMNNLVAFVLGLFPETAETTYIVLLILSLVLFPVCLYLLLEKSPVETREKILYKPVKQRGFSAGMFLCFLVYGIFSLLIMLMNMAENIM